MSRRVLIRRLRSLIIRRKSAGLHGSGYAYRCGECDGEPAWRVTRRGDVAVLWACSKHVHVVCVDLQRDFEVTELVVTDCVKAHEWATISQHLEEIAGGRR